MPDYYEILGVDREATKEEIKAAYKLRAQSLHPDKGGGVEEFKELSKAFKVLINDEKRARYDRGEDTNQPIRTVEAMAKERLAMLFQQMIQSCGPGQDIIAKMRQQLSEGRANLDKDEKKVKQSLKNVEKLRKRMHYKGKDEGNVFASVLDNAENGGKASLENFAKEREIQELVRQLLDDYEIEVETSPLRSHAADSFFGRTGPTGGSYF